MDYPNLQCTLRALSKDQKDSFFKLIKKRIVIISDILSEFPEICSLSSALFGFNEIHIYTSVQRKQFFGKTIKEAETEEEGLEEILNRVPTLKEGKVKLIRSIDNQNINKILEKYKNKKQSTIFITDNPFIFKEIRGKKGYLVYLGLPYSNISGIIDSVEQADKVLNNIQLSNKTISSSLICCGSFLQKLYLDTVLKMPIESTILKGNFNDPEGGAIIVGCGGIGCWHALTYLNSNRKVLLIDPDEYQNYNLNRQWPYLICGSKNKAKCLSKLLNSMAGSSKFEYIPKKIEKIDDNKLREFVLQHGPLYGYIFTDTFVSRWFAFNKLTQFQQGNVLEYILNTASGPFSMEVEKLKIPRDHILSTSREQIINDMLYDSLFRGKEDMLDIFKNEGFSISNISLKQEPKKEIVSCGNVGTPSVVFMDMIAAGLSNYILHRKENNIKWDFSGITLNEIDLSCNNKINQENGKLINIAARIYG